MSRLVTGNSVSTFPQAFGFIAGMRPGSVRKLELAGIGQRMAVAIIVAQTSGPKQANVLAINRIAPQTLTRQIIPREPLGNRLGSYGLRSRRVICVRVVRMARYCLLVLIILKRFANQRQCGDSGKDLGNVTAVGAHWCGKTCNCDCCGHYYENEFAVHVVFLSSQGSIWSQ